MDITYYSWRDYPYSGWDIKGKHIFPPNAYTNEIFWLSHIVDVFPKLKRYIHPDALTPSQVQETVFRTIERLNEITRYKKAD